MLSGKPCEDSSQGKGKKTREKVASYTGYSFDTLQKGEIHENLVRKNFTTSERIAVKRALEPTISAEAKERQKAGVPSSNLDEGRTDSKIASFVGVGKDTLRKDEAIVEAAEKEPEKFGPLLAKVDSGKISVNAAHIQIRRAQRRGMG